MAVKSPEEEASVGVVRERRSIADRKAPRMQSTPGILLRIFSAVSAASAFTVILHVLSVRVHVLSPRERSDFKVPEPSTETDTSYRYSV